MDGATASEVCNALERKNVSCWLKGRHHDQESIIDATFNALNDSRLFVVIFSKHSKHSNYVNTEVDIAFSRDIPIYTFQIDESKLSGGLKFFLTNNPWIDATSNFKNGLDSLIEYVLMMLSPTLKISITFSTTSDIVTVDDVIALSGTLMGESEHITGGKVDIFRGNELVDTVLSSGSGKFSALVPVNNTGLYYFKATFNGNKRYDACESEDVVVEVVDEITHDQSGDVIKRPFEAYKGDEPYIFISYAHKDAPLVFPEIKVFHDEGYPIWYDQGLTPGQEWDYEVASALINCTLLVVFISENSMNSNNVQDEIKLALKRNINVVPIYLEEMELPIGLELRLSNKHAIKKYMMDRDDYILECFKAFNKERIPKIDFND